MTAASTASCPIFRHPPARHDASSAKYYSQYPVAGTNWGRNAQSYSYVPTTWMPADILAAQRLYGLPASTPLSGGQTFGFNSNVAGASGIFFDFTKEHQPGGYALGRRHGQHASIFPAFSTASNINLNAGTFSSCDAMTNNICIAQGTAIDDLVEGNGANTVLANNDGDIIVQEAAPATTRLSAAPATTPSPAAWATTPSMAALAPTRARGAGQQRQLRLHHAQFERHRHGAGRQARPTP